MMHRTSTLIAVAIVSLSMVAALGCFAEASPSPVAGGVSTGQVQAAEPTAARDVPNPAPAAPATTPREAATGWDSGIASSDPRAQAEEFIAYYQSIALTPEQERIKVEALSTIPAPCCSENSLATCCCPCNLAKSAWGLSAWLITEKGYGVEQVRAAALDWLERSNPNGFAGNACSSGGCNRSFDHDGCGGMDDRHIL